MYNVFEMDLPHFKRNVGKVETIEEGEKFLATKGEMILFERDPDGHDAADAAVMRKTGVLQLYAIERA